MKKYKLFLDVKDILETDYPSKELDMAKINLAKTIKNAPLETILENIRMKEIK